MILVLTEVALKHVPQDSRRSPELQCVLCAKHRPRQPQVGVEPNTP